MDPIFVKFRNNLHYFDIDSASISQRDRVLIDKAVNSLSCREEDFDEDVLILIGALRQRSWDIIHTGKWNEVLDNDKYLYGLCTYLEVLVKHREHLIANYELNGRSQTIIEDMIESLDMAILLGLPVRDHKGDNVFCTCATTLSQYLNVIKDSEEFEVKMIDDKLENVDVIKTDISIKDREFLTPDQFALEYYDKGQPVLIKNGINQWPAMEKWRDVSYFQRNFGYRTVPVEIGSQYTTDDWGQELLLFKDFLDNQFGGTPTKSIQYLAQHDLFHQIPELRRDIRNPTILGHLNILPDDVDTKIWFGPGGTISPLHYDKKENFLCQVIGWKRIILISPDDSAFVYPFDGEMLHNTSQLDLSTDAVDNEKFPLASKITKRNVLLGPGHTLFIPFGWWHFVTSLTPSISVSFWWNRVEDNVENQF